MYCLGFVLFCFYFCLIQGLLYSPDCPRIQSVDLAYQEPRECWVGRCAPLCQIIVLFVNCMVLRCSSDNGFMSSLFMIHFDLYYFFFLAMQEEALKLVLLALEDGSALSRKVLVLFVVQRLEPRFPQASKTSIGHVVQLLYRASCFKVWI